MDDLFSTPPQNNSQGINLDKPNDNIGSTNNSNGFGYGSTAYNSKPSSDYNNGNFGYGSTAYNAQQNNANSNSQFGYGETRTSNAYDNTGYSNNNAYGNSGYGNSGYNNNSYGNSGYGNSGYGNNSYNNDSYSNRGYDGGFSASPAFDGFGSSFERSAELMDYVKGVLGALIGVMPGFLLIIILGPLTLNTGKLGLFLFALMGFVMTLGMCWGFNLFTKNVNIPKPFSIGAFGVISLIAIYIGVKIVICQELEQLLRSVFDIATSSGLVDSDVKDTALSLMGLREISFGEIYSKFNSLIDMANVKGDFIFRLVVCYLFAASGGYVYLKKIKK